MAPNIWENKNKFSHHWYAFNIPSTFVVNEQLSTIPHLFILLELWHVTVYFTRDSHLSSSNSLLYVYTSSMRIVPHIYVGISGKVVLQINSCLCQLFLLILSFVSRVGAGPATWVHSIDKYWAGLKSTIFVFRYFGYYAATTDKIIAFITKKNHSCYISCSCYVYCYYAIRINNFFYKIVQQYSGV